jgi:hypothetical protein
VQVEPAEIRFASRPWGYLSPALPQLLIVAGCIALLVLDSSNWIAWVLLLPSGGLAGARLLALRHAIRIRWLITVGPDGVRWNDTGAHVTWLEVAQIRVFVATGWRRLLPHLPNRVVLVTPAEADFAARARSRPIGRSIFLSRVAAGPEAVVDALRQFTDAPLLRGGAV